MPLQTWCCVSGVNVLANILQCPPQSHNNVDLRVTQCSPTWDKPTKQTQISMGMTGGFATHFNRAKSLQVGLFPNIIFARVSLHQSNNDTQYQ